MYNMNRLSDGKTYPVIQDWLGIRDVRYVHLSFIVRVYFYERIKKQANL